MGGSEETNCGGYCVNRNGIMKFASNGEIIVAWGGEDGKINVHRMRQDGSFVWPARTIVNIPTTSIVHVHDLILNNDGSIFAAYNYGLTYGVVKLTSSGTFVFDKFIDTASNSAMGNNPEFSVMSDNTNGFVARWHKDYSPQLDYLARYDSQGNQIFKRSTSRYFANIRNIAGGNVFRLYRDLFLSSDGKIFYTSILGLKKASLADGADDPSYSTSGYGIFLPDNQGGIYSLAIGSGTANSISVIRINNSGQFVWSKTLMTAGQGKDFLEADLALDENKNIYVLARERTDWRIGPSCDSLLFGGCNLLSIIADSEGNIWRGWQAFNARGGKVQPYYTALPLGNGEMIPIFSLVANEEIKAKRLGAIEINSVTDLPDPSIVGQNITFSVDGYMTGNTPTMIRICKNNSNIDCNPGPMLCEDNVPSTQNTKSCNYIVVSSDLGANTYYAWLCGNSYADCLRSSAQTFTVTTGSPPIVSIPECSEDAGTNYASCNTITLNNIITNVKANCTDPNNNISNVRFILTNPSGIQVFNAINSSVVGTEYFLDNTDINVNSIGNWTLTATCTDSASLTDTESITWNVSAINQPPTTNIIFPNDGNNFAVGQEINFIGTAIDPEDGTLSGNSLQWSIEDGTNIGTGTDFNYSLLTIGTHTITLTATDTQGLTGSTSIQIEIVETPIEKIIISNMQVRPFIVRNEQGITTYTTIKNNTNTPADVELNLATNFECTFQNQPQTQTLQPRETYTFESMLNFAADCANPLTDADYWINATANTQNSSDKYRALFTYKQIQSVAVPETSIMLI
ncbi:MAG: PKD domain-containing protein, partial [Candidatus Woesearchaeota archaeon]|nr:PKD domain-containing protein [Candidatus Woesearchaeota archaeon]